MRFFLNRWHEQKPKHSEDSRLLFLSHFYSIWINMVYDNYSSQAATSRQLSWSFSQEFQGISSKSSKFKWIWWTRAEVNIRQGTIVLRRNSQNLEALSGLLEKSCQQKLLLRLSQRSKKGANHSEPYFDLDHFLRITKWRLVGNHWLRHSCRRWGKDFEDLDLCSPTFSAQILRYGWHAKFWLPALTTWFPPDVWDHRIIAMSCFF